MTRAAPTIKGLIALILIATTSAAAAEGGTPQPSSEPPALGVPHELAPCPYDAVHVRCVGPQIYMDAVVRYRVNGTLYEIPAAYLTDWPTADEVAKGRSNDRGGLPEFAFWMPRRRPELIKTAPPIQVDAIQRRGGRWANDEYPVVVQGPRLVGPDEPGVMMPEVAFDRRRAVTGGPGNQFTEEYGAQRFKLERNKSGSIDYKQVPGQDPQFLMWCSGEGEYPLCQAYAYYTKDRLYFRTYFSFAHAKDWHAIFDAVRDLVNSWRKPE